VLSQHSCVQETVVLAQEDELGNQRLVAYVVKPEQAPTISELRSFCKEVTRLHAAFCLDAAGGNSSDA